MHNGGKCYLLQVPVEGLTKSQHCKMLNCSPTVTLRTLQNVIRKAKANFDVKALTKDSCVELYLSIFHSDNTDDTGTQTTGQTKRVVTKKGDRFII
jgi:hypothetical protein